MTTTASAQIIIATCDLVPLDADDFDPAVVVVVVVVDALGLPRTTFASSIVVPVNPADDKVFDIIAVDAVKVVARAVVVVPDFITR
jgi:hypothetical protein